MRARGRREHDDERARHEHCGREDDEGEKDDERTMRGNAGLREDGKMEEGNFSYMLAQVRI